MATLIHEAVSVIPELEGKFITGQLGCKEEFDSSGYTCFIDDGVLPTDEKIKLIKALNNIKAKIHLRSKNLYVRLVNLIQKQSGVWTSTDIILSNTKQWSELLIHFKDTNSHFEKFKIKLPHARGNAVDGVGNPDRVRDFYRHINYLGVVGRVDIDSYRSTEACLEPVTPIPDGHVSIYIPEDEDTAFVGWGSEFKSISLNQGLVTLRSCFEGSVIHPGIRIITNKGKQVAKELHSCGLPDCEIIDVVIAEKLIANGEVEYRCLKLKTVFSRYDLPEGLERKSVVHRLMDVWHRQEPLIQSAGLKSIFDIETRLIWVTAKIETAGIGIDADGLLRYYDLLNAKLEKLTASLEKSIPADIPINNRERIKEHLNSAYFLSLAKIDKESIKTIPNAEVNRLASNLIDYWKTERDCRDVELYISLTGTDDRVYDSIDQLNTKTGRFYRPLQTVQKDGPMRSLFRAKEGYKFIVADYSQQEARIIAGFSDDRVAIDLFKAGKDIYMETAKIIMGHNAHSVRYRALGKEICLGLNNGRTYYSIFERLIRLGFCGDVSDVQGMIHRYEREFAGTKTWRDEVESSGLKNGVVSTKLGRSLKVEKDVNVNSLYNYPVQGTAADGFKLSLIKLDGYLKDLDASVVHILHDEIIVEARDDIADAVASIVKTCMERALTNMLPGVPFVVVPEVKDSWG